MKINLHCIVMLLTISPVLMNCSDEGEPYERITKLRAIGSSVETVFALPKDVGDKEVVELTLHALVPADEEIVVALAHDPGDTGLPALRPDGEVVLRGTAYEEYDSLRYATAKVQYTLPTLAEAAPYFADGVAAMLFTVRISSGDESELVVGKIPLLQESSDDFKLPSISIDTPTDQIAKGGDVTVKASTDNLGSEEYKIGWFVSEGEIKNRRAAETTWKTGTSGKQLLIATIRGKRSQSVAIDIKEFSAE